MDLNFTHKAEKNTTELTNFYEKYYLSLKFYKN